MSENKKVALEDLKDERSILVDEVKELGESFERGDNKPEQVEEYDSKYARIEELDSQIATIERAEQAKKLEISRSFQSGQPTHSGQHVKVARKPSKRDYNNALKAWICAGFEGGDVKDSWLRSCDLVQCDHKAKEFYCRDQTTDVTNEGAELVSGSQFQGIVEAKAHVGNMLDYCGVINSSVGSRDIHFAALDDTATVGAYKTQATALSNVGLTYTPKTLGEWNLTSGVFPVSLPFIEDSETNAIQHINDILNRRYIRTVVQDITNGDGSGKPTGFTDSNDGVTEEGSSAVLTAVTPDDIYDLFFSVDAEYRESSKCAFVMHDLMLAHLMSEFTDSDLRPIWGSGLNGSPVLTMMGKPIVINNNLPTPDYESALVYFGDWDFHKVRFVGAPRLIRDDSRLADQLSVFLAIWGRVDSLYVNPGNHPLKVLNTIGS